MIQPALIPGQAAYRPPANRPWLPPSLRDLSAPRRVKVVWSAAERKVCRKHKPLAPSLWAEQHRIVTMSSVPGPWRNSTTPYLAGIMDASFYRSVQEVSICKAPQTGGTEAVNNCLAYSADRAPGPALVVYPDENTARENCQDRITPIFVNSPRLRELLTGRDDDAQALKIKLLSMPIYMAWSRSVSRLANKPCRYVIFDETDKYQPSNNAETDPLRLGELRTNTFRWNKKIWKISSPTTESGYIWQAMTNAQIVFEYAVRCPTCHQLQVMRFGDKETPDGIKWPADQRDPDTIQDKELAWYACAHCQAHWSDYQRDQAVANGHWQARDDGRSLFAALEARRPRRIAFHLPAWLSPFVSLSKIAAEYLRCKPDGKTLDLNAHKNFCNAILAEPWFHYEQERKEDAILALRDDRPAGLVPGHDQVATLVAGVDSQDDGFWYKIAAVSYPIVQEASETRPAHIALNIWEVRYGFVEDFAALAAILWYEDYRDAAGNQYLVELALQDAMGHRTKEVYDFCVENRGRIFPTKGERTKKQPYTYSNLETYPNSSKPIPGGLKLVNLNTTLYKDNLSSKLNISPSDPGAWRLHQEPDEQAMTNASQMVAEYRDDAGFWQCPSGHANHLWDCSVLILAAADIRRLKFRPRPDRDQAETQARPAPIRSKYMQR